MHNTNYLIDNKLWQLRPKCVAINTYRTSDNIIIGMFQGSRGQFPDIDFKVKILKSGIDETPFPPEHNLWVVDLMLKIFDFKDDVKMIVEYYLDFYDKLTPFQTPESRVNYQPQTVDYISRTFNKINQNNTLSIDYVAFMIELFCINEKRNQGAYMFRDLLNTLLQYINGDVDYITLMRATKAGYR
jgi:hypothetical protein